MNKYVIAVQALEYVEANSIEEAKEIALKESTENADLDLVVASWIEVE